MLTAVISCERTLHRKNGSNTRRSLNLSMAPVNWIFCWKSARRTRLAKMKGSTNLVSPSATTWTALLQITHITVPIRTYRDIPGIGIPLDPLGDHLPQTSQLRSAQSHESPQYRTWGTWLANLKDSSILLRPGERTPLTERRKPRKQNPRPGEERGPGALAGGGDTVLAWLLSKEPRVQASHLDPSWQLPG